MAQTEEEKAAAEYQRSLQRLSASAKNAREGIERDDLQSLKEAVGRLSTATDRLAATQSQLAAGRPVGAVGSALGGIASATGNEGLGAVAQAITALSGPLDKIATLLPDLGAHLQKLVGTDLARAGAKVGALAGEAAARGAPLPTETLRAMLEAEALGERRRISAQADVDAQVTDLQARRILGYR